MTTIPTTTDGFSERLVLIRRHLRGIEAALDTLEAEIRQRRQVVPVILPGVTGETKPDGERAAQRARDAAIGPQELKIDTSTLSDDEIADIRRRYVDTISH